MPHAPRKIACALALGLTLGSAPLAAQALDKIKIGLLKVSACGPVFIAQEKGLFAKEGLEAELAYFDQPALVPQGIIGGELDFGIVAPTAAFYNLAAQGAMHIIAGNADEAPGFKGLVVVASNQAYAAGLKTIRDLAGHSFAIGAAGTPQQYDLGVLAQKYGFDYASLRQMPLGSFANMVSAIVGGSADSGFPPLSAARQAIAGEKLHVLASIGDEMRMTVAVTMTAARTADTNAALVNRFLRVYAAGVRDYHDAFTGPDERPLDGPEAAEDYAILAKYTEVPLATMKLGLIHIDRDARLDVGDVMHQIAWYKAQGMVKPEVDGAKIIDRRYVVPLPEN